MAAPDAASCRSLASSSGVHRLRGVSAITAPSAQARPCGGLAHAFHERSLRRIQALLDAVARTADQRECKGHDRQDAQLLISRPATTQARPAVDGKGERAEARPKGDGFSAR
jgi:hypothetical protein